IYTHTGRRSQLPFKLRGFHTHIILLKQKLIGRRIQSKDKIWTDSNRRI
ncbi:unnamed protein product, partial [Allacma fusca]